MCCREEYEERARGEWRKEKAPWSERPKRPPPPGVFSEVFIPKDFKSNDSVSAHSKGVRSEIFVSAHPTGVSCEFTPEERSFDSRCSLRIRILGRMLTAYSKGLRRRTWRATGGEWRAPEEEKGATAALKTEITK